MLTRRIDRALEAMYAVRDRFPDLAALYPPGSPKRLALDEAQAAVERAREILFAPRVATPAKDAPDA